MFAFIGFEDMVNVVEETKRPNITMPWAIFLTLIFTTILYTLVTLVAVLTTPSAELAQSEAPLSAVYEALTGRSPIVISGIAIFATLNTILIQFIMTSRVIYGMANTGTLPKVLSTVSGKTRTPLLATALVAITTAGLAIAIPLDQLAETTSLIILVIWTFANLALVLIKLRKEPVPAGNFEVAMWVPIAGFLFCSAFILIAPLG